MKYIHIIIVFFIFSSCQAKKQDTQGKTVIETITDKTPVVKTNSDVVVSERVIKENIVAEVKETTETNPIIDTEEKTASKKEESNTTVPKSSVTTVIEKNVVVPTTETVIEPVKNRVPETTVSEIKKEVFSHALWHSLLQKHVSSQGNVNYKGFKNDHEALTKYITTLSNNTPDTNWSRAKKLAYWINAYNALTVDLILRNYPLKSIKDIKNPWDQELWTLGEKKYDLNEIEHGILRKMNEPRIHFAIVCASFSCPKLENKAFTANGLEIQLTKATEGFLADPARNNITEDTIKISKIFKWFAKDFKTKGTLIDFINSYSTITVNSKASKSFKDYNWSLNE